jgi:hypothetical protein
MSGPEEHYPDTLPGDDAPPLPDGFHGVRIAAPPRVPAAGPLVVAGAFRLPADAARELGEHPHRALVLVVWRESSHHASTPFRDAVLFEDDCRDGPSGRQGWFHVDAFAHGGFAGAPGAWYVSCALGTHVSDSLEVRVE